MKTLLARWIGTVCLILTSSAAWSQGPGGLLLHHSFEELGIDTQAHIRTVKDQALNRKDTVSGTYAALKKGISGKSLLLDGYSSYLSSSHIPIVDKAFTVEGWLAIGAYPTSYTAIAEQLTGGRKGFSLGIDGFGLPLFKIGTARGLQEIKSKTLIPLHRWTHIAGSFDGRTMKLFINGQEAASRQLEAVFTPADRGVFLSGVSSLKSKTVSVIREDRASVIEHYLDAVIDEIKIWDKALSPSAFSNTKALAAKAGTPELGERHLPTLPDTRTFGAVYCNLKFYESWDKIWRMAGTPDVVVNFDLMGGHFVFWRGTTYIPHWVTENGIWYNNEFCETWSKTGGHEPMADKRCEYSQVKIVESNPARCIVHWRYALVDNRYTVAHINPVTGWGDWVDEIYTIYPDGMAVRSQTLHSDVLSDYDHGYSHEWQESMIILGQGQTPESILHDEALCFANMEGQQHIYSWKEVDRTTPDSAKKTYVINMDKHKRKVVTIPDPNIQVVNTRSEFKPFTIASAEDDPIWDIYVGEIRREVSKFPWWNHWPTAVKQSDGRFALFSDRGAHSSLSHLLRWRPYKKDEYKETRLLLNGLTDKSATDMIPVTRFWSHPAPIKVVAGAADTGGYDKAEMAYRIRCRKGCKQLKLQVDGSADAPIITPAFVIADWNTEKVDIRIDGKKIQTGKTVRCGFNHTDRGIDLIIWIHRKSSQKMEIGLSK